MSRLAGKIALITGGTSGIGAATAQLFRQEGAQVVATGSSMKSVVAARERMPPSISSNRTPRIPAMI